MNMSNDRATLNTVKIQNPISRLLAPALRSAGRLLGTMIFFLYWNLPANAVGLIPVPKLQGVVVNSSAAYDSSRGLFFYTYEVTSGAASVGDIGNMKIDITRAPHQRTFGGNYGLDVGSGANRVPFEQAYANRKVLMDLPPGTTLISVGLSAPIDWRSNVSVDGYASFSAMTGEVQVSPGETVDGLLLESPGVPTIRRVVIKPDWILAIPPDVEDIDALYDQAADAGKEMLVHTVALGPAGLSSRGSTEHWDQLHADIVRAGELGWIADPVWQGEVLSKLSFAKEAFDARDGTLAKERLQPVLALLDTSDLAQRNQETKDLVFVNVNSLIENTSDTPIPYEPALILSPLESTQSVGAEQAFVAKLVNLADDKAPVSGVTLELRVVEGPHRNVWLNETTGEDGTAQFKYTGKNVGLDQIIVQQFSGYAGETPVGDNKQVVSRSREAARAGGAQSPKRAHSSNIIHAEARVNWTGGVDLVVPLFIPPYLKTQSGSSVEVIEETANHGTVASPTTTTVYTLKHEGASHYLGERTVPPLQAGEVSDAQEVSFIIPEGFATGWYDIVACADGNGAVIELDEANNCSTNQLQTGGSAIFVLESIENRPPVCTQASTEPATLWPPNHKLETISILGVTDPENSPVTVSVTSIHQDEPTNGLGDGDTTPDGFGIDEASAQLRRERSGTGNGRVYIIGFSAVDNQGASCEGEVTVGVPHDQSPQAEAVDDGTRFDSTK